MLKVGDIYLNTCLRTIIIIYIYILQVKIIKYAKYINIYVHYIV